MKPTQERISEAIENLKRLRHRVVPKSIFGDDNIKMIDAVIQVLEQDLSFHAIGRNWGSDMDDLEIYYAARDARYWMEGDAPGEYEPDNEEEWPLKDRYAHHPPMG